MGYQGSLRSPRSPVRGASGVCHVVGRGNRYLKLRDQGGAIARWDTQEQVLWYDAAPRLAQKLAARRRAVST
jgi:hypothetical protein